jgi:hypothetical protein
VEHNSDDKGINASEQYISTNESSGRIVTDGDAETTDLNQYVAARFLGTVSGALQGPVLRDSGGSAGGDRFYVLRTTGAAGGLNIFAGAQKANLGNIVFISIGNVGPADGNMISGDSLGLEVDDQTGNDVTFTVYHWSGQAPPANHDDWTDGYTICTAACDQGFDTAPESAGAGSADTGKRGGILQSDSSIEEWDDWMFGDNPTPTPTPNPALLLPLEDFEYAVSGDCNDDTGYPNIALVDATGDCSYEGMTNQNGTYAMQIDDTSARERVFFLFPDSATSGQVVCDMLFESEAVPNGPNNRDMIHMAQTNGTPKGAGLNVRANEEVAVMTDGGPSGATYDLTDNDEVTLQLRLVYGATESDCDALGLTALDADDNGDCSVAYFSSLGEDWDDVATPIALLTDDSAGPGTTDLAQISFLSETSASNTYAIDDIACCNALPADPTTRCE